MDQPKKIPLTWHVPKIGFEVLLKVSSTIYKSDEIADMLGLQPTRTRSATDEIHKANLWYLEANESLTTIQEHIDDILTQAQSRANQFKSIKDCYISLDVYLYKEEFEAYHGTHPSFCLENRWIELLHKIGAEFTLD